MGAQDYEGMDVKSPMTQPDIAVQYPPYPSDHSTEAHERAKWIQSEIDSLDENHSVYMDRYTTRREELQLMMEMCHKAINAYDQATGPQHAVPISSDMVPGGSSQRGPYDTGIRPPKVSH